MTKIKAKRNKTIDTSVENGKKFLDRCINVQHKVGSIDTILNKTICGNTFEVMPYLPEKCFDLVIADPPYNLTKSYNGSLFSKKARAEYEEFTRKWLGLVFPLLKDSGSIYVCCDWESSLVIGNVLGDYFNVRNRITWEREKGRGASANWKNSMEDIWFATKSNSYKFNLDAVKIRRKVLAPYRVDGKPKDWDETDSGNFRDTCPSNFWDDITVPFWSMTENTAHPTQKPEKLIAKMILASSEEGDCVFDPFLGSGTTSVTAKKLGRNYIGIEAEDRYCIWAEERLEMAEIDKTIQGFSDGVFYERNTPYKK
ncbi:MAG: site-specific DNA-methyltransferase [Ruminococcaceae bacterium]|nr:site-specific DNA-methyltransferase [Oscillospiraceae bacterium]